jgi:hypothetical protein
MGILADLGLVRSGASKTGRIFEELVPDFFHVPGLSSDNPAAYISTCWSEYQRAHPSEDVGTNGKFFELCIATLLVREDILPMYLQAQVAFVPNIEYDFILYAADRGPICISTKTTLRERYKQADLEAVALKYVHRRAESFLVNLSEDENRNLQKKIGQGGLIGLDDSFYALGDEFNRFIQRLKKRTLIIAPEVKVVTSQAIITREIVGSRRR